MPAPSKSRVHSLPGNAFSDPRFHEETDTQIPLEVDNGDIGFDSFGGGDPTHSKESPKLPFKLGGK